MYPNTVVNHDRTKIAGTIKVPQTIPWEVGVVLESVVIRALGGVAAVRWLVGATERVAYVTNRRGFESVRAGGEPQHTVGVPLLDVFIDEGSVSDGQVPDWTALKAFRAFRPTSQLSSTMMAKRGPLRLPGTFEEALGDLLKVKPRDKGAKVASPKRKRKAVKTTKGSSVRRP
ncbi:hypothetical protein BH24ACI5_BH24ACI5_17130 [soil metagenome]